MEKLPCEVAVWDIVPAIRAALAQEMVSSGLIQKDVARILQIQPSAVSQYISGKRGYRIVFSDEVLQEIQDLARNLIQGKNTDFSQSFCKICIHARNTTQACDLCEENISRHYTPQQ
ncbi:MAG: transcriptional regulator [Methanospirillaceae archaeon]|nr:transcriptional regulator [Methanospirillaceae archaeon]